MNNMVIAIGIILFFVVIFVTEWHYQWYGNYSKTSDIAIVGMFIVMILIIMGIFL